MNIHIIDLPVEPVTHTVQEYSGGFFALPYLFHPFKVSVRNKRITQITPSFLLGGIMKSSVSASKTIWPNFTIFTITTYYKVAGEALRTVRITNPLNLSFVHSSLPRCKTCIPYYDDRTHILENYMVHSLFLHLSFIILKGNSQLT